MRVVIGAGNVIRVDETMSVGVYNMNTKVGYGYDYNKIDRQALSGMTFYNNLVLISTNNANGGTPKIYYYDYLNNTMVDSISFGFTNYGGIWTQGEQLLGQAGTRFYKINLSTKQIIYNQQGKGNPNVARLQDGKFIISGGTAPAGWAQMVTSTYNNWVGVNGVYYSVSSQTINSTSDIANEAIDLNTADGIMKYTKKCCII